MEENLMFKRRKVLLTAGIAFFFLLVCITVLCVIPKAPYPGMRRVASHVAHGNTANGDHNIELLGLREGQLVVIETENGSGVTGSWIRHSSTETFVLEGQGLTDGKLEYEVREDADYTFQLKCDDVIFDVSISVWEKK